MITEIYVHRDGTVKMHCGSNNLDYEAMDAVNAWDEDTDFEYEAQEYYDSEADWDAIEEFLNR